MSTIFDNHFFLMLFSFLSLISSQRYRKIRPFKNVNNNFEVVTFFEKCYSGPSPQCFNPILEYSLSFDQKSLLIVKSDFEHFYKSMIYYDYSSEDFSILHITRRDVPTGFHVFLPVIMMDLVTKKYNFFKIGRASCRERVFLTV